MGGRGEGGEKANGKSQCTNLDLRSTRNGNDIVTLTKNPREANLPSTRISPRPNLFQPVRKFEDIREVFLREPSRQILKDLSAIYIYEHKVVYRKMIYYPYLGMVRLKSSGAKSSSDLYWPVSSRRPIGE